MARCVAYTDFVPAISIFSSAPVPCVSSENCNMSFDILLELCFNLMKFVQKNALENLK